MENSDKKQLTPRDPEYYKGRYPDRLEPPEKSLADEVASAIAQDLYRKESEKNPPKFPAIFFPPDDQTVAQKFDISLLPSYTTGIFLFPPREPKNVWMLRGHRMNSEELNEIEDAFEGFVNTMEWEDE